MVMVITSVVNETADDDRDSEVYSKQFNFNRAPQIQQALSFLGIGGNGQIDENVNALRSWAMSANSADVLKLHYSYIIRIDREPKFTTAELTQRQVAHISIEKPKRGGRPKKT